MKAGAVIEEVELPLFDAAFHFTAEHALLDASLTASVEDYQLDVLGQIPERRIEIELVPAQLPWATGLRNTHLCVP